MKLHVKEKLVKTLDMTGRNRNTNGKIEAIIESCRSEGKWKRVIELAEELKVGSPSNYGKDIVSF